MPEIKTRIQPPPGRNLAIAPERANRITAANASVLRNQKFHGAFQPTLWGIELHSGTLGRRLLAAFFLVLAAALLPVRAAQNVPLEPAVKATFLYKFMPFVMWPADAFESPTSPAVICTLGADPVTDLVDEAIAGQRFDQHPLTVRHLQSIRRDTACNVLYIAVSDAASVAQAVAAVRGRPVLTVTDSERLARVPAIISFVVENNRVRFDIDQNAAAENNLVLSSKLLNLARTVRAPVRRQ